MYDNWEKLEAEVKQCQKCRLCQNRNNVVFGVGNKNAKLMLIGEGPGADEDRLRRTICRKSRTINEYGISNVRNKKRRSIYSEHSKM